MISPFNVSESTAGGATDANYFRHPDSLTALNRNSTHARSSHSGHEDRDCTVTAYTLETLVDNCIIVIASFNRCEKTKHPLNAFACRFRWCWRWRCCSCCCDHHRPVDPACLETAHFLSASCTSRTCPRCRCAPASPGILGLRLVLCAFKIFVCLFWVWDGGWGNCTDGLILQYLSERSTREMGTTTATKRIKLVCSVQCSIIGSR